MPTGQVAGLLDKLHAYWMRTGLLDQLQTYWMRTGPLDKMANLLDGDRSTGQVAGFLGPIGAC